MDINEMTLKDVQERLAAIAVETRNITDAEAIAKLNAEVDQLQERKKELEAIEERKAQAAALTEGTVPANYRITKYEHT